MGAGDVNLIAKIAPKNDGFTGLVDAKQVIGGASNRLLAAVMPAFTGDVTSTEGTVALTLVGASVAWTEVTAHTSMVTKKGYIVNNISRIELTLPATAAVGDIVAVTGKGAGGWKILQNASQTIHFGIYASLAGVGGYLQSDDYRDTVQLICITLNTDWKVVWCSGNININIS